MWSLLEFFPEPFRIEVIDVGAAFIEDPPYAALVKANRCRVIGFEPHPTACQDLIRRHGPPHLFFPYFVGDGKPGTFYEMRYAVASSLLPPNTPLVNHFQQLEEVMQVVNTHRVETVRLDDLEGVEKVDWIKIDVQGGELLVFENAERLLRDTLVIQAEASFLPLYVDQPLFADIDAFMRAHGFVLHLHTPSHCRTFRPLLVNNDSSAGLNQVLWTDVVYVRDWMKLDRLSDEQLRNLAIIAHDGYGSFDLANVYLAALDQRRQSSLSSAYLSRLVPN